MLDWARRVETKSNQTTGVSEQKTESGKNAEKTYEEKINVSCVSNEMKWH